jgi:hypothetical protein
MNTTQTTRRPPTTEQIKREQQQQAERDLSKRKFTPLGASYIPGGSIGPSAEKAALPAKADGSTAVATGAEDTRTPVQKYLDEIAPSGIVGRLIKFSKEGNFVTADDGEVVSGDADFVALCDQTLIGWIKFHADGETPPDRAQGLLHGGFKMPDRASLGDNDQAEWPIGLSGQPADPWQHQVCIVLQNTETNELYTFATTSQTGRRAAGNLLRHYDRMQRTNPSDLPIVRLRPGGYQHRDERIGWVATPTFVVVGRTPRDSAAKPDTSIAADMSDSLPF